MILCVTPNPAIDRTLTVSAFQAGEVHRAANTIVAAGGKGLNVARVLQRLGGTAACAGFLGGHSGRLLQDLLRAEGLPGYWAMIEGETRTCIILADAAAQQASVINEVGPQVSAEDWAALRAQIEQNIPNLQSLCICGSLPPGDGAALFASWLKELLQLLQPQQIPIWVDASGAGLRAALTVPGISVKVNEHEAAEALGESAAGYDWAVDVARRLHKRQAAPVALTLGAQGALLVNDAGAWFGQAPKVEALSSVGSGDSFLAALLLPADDPALSLRRAVAAGAANTLSYGGGRFEMADYERCFEATEIRQI